MIVAVAVAVTATMTTADNKLILRRSQSTMMCRRHNNEQCHDSTTENEKKTAGSAHATETIKCQGLIVQMTRGQRSLMCLDNYFFFYVYSRMYNVIRRAAEK